MPGGTRKRHVTSSRGTCPSRRAWRACSVTVARPRLRGTGGQPDHVTVTKAEAPRTGPAVGVLSVPAAEAPGRGRPCASARLSRAPDAPSPRPAARAGGPGAARRAPLHGRRGSTRRSGRGAKRQCALGGEEAGQRPQRWGLEGAWPPPSLRHERRRPCPPPWTGASTAAAWAQPPHAGRPPPAARHGRGAEWRGFRAGPAMSHRHGRWAGLAAPVMDDGLTWAHTTRVLGVAAVVHGPPVVPVG